MERDQEAQAIQAVLDGDPEPFAEIVSAYQNLVASVAWKMNVPPDRIEDVVSEVFLKVYQKLGKYDDRYAFSTWLYRITSNHILDRFRRRSRRPETDLDAVPEPVAEDLPVEEGLLAEERREQVRATVNDLPDIYRQVLVLHHLEGLPVAEVSETLGVPEGTVKVRLMRGRERLRDALETTAPELFGGRP